MKVLLAIKEEFASKIFEGSKREFAESRCYIAYDVFQSNLGKISTYILTKNFPNFPPPSTIHWENEHHPEIISNNLVD